VLETIELDVDEVEETEVLAEDADERIEETVLLSVRVTVELIVDDEAIEDPRDVVGEELELDEGIETEDVEPGACSVMAAPSATSVSTTATARIV
jgi:hypothetical protein